MTKIFIVICISSLFTQATAQTPKERAELFAQRLNLDSFCIYSFPCIGNLPYDSCRPKETHFVFWIDANKYYIKKFEKCFTYSSLQIDLENPLQYYFSNRQAIDTEKIQPPTYFEYKKTKKGIDTIMIVSGVDHSCHHKLTIVLNGREINKSVDTYDLEFIKFNTGQENIYYKINQQTSLKKLLDKLTEFTKQINQSGKFQIE